MQFIITLPKFGKNNVYEVFILIGKNVSLYCRDVLIFSIFINFFSLLLIKTSFFVTQNLYKIVENVDTKLQYSRLSWIRIFEKFEPAFRTGISSNFREHFIIVFYFDTHGNFTHTFFYANSKIQVTFILVLFSSK